MLSYCQNFRGQWSFESYPQHVPVLSGASVVSDLRPYGLQPTSLLCPWATPGKNTGAGCMPSSRGSSQARDRTLVSYLFCIGRWVPCHLLHMGSPQAAGILTTVKINSTVVPAAIDVCLVHVPGFSLFFVLFGDVSVFVHFGQDLLD